LNNANSIFKLSSCSHKADLIGDEIEDGLFF